MITPIGTKAACAYLRDGKIFLQPSIRIGKYAWRHSTPILVTNEHDKGLGALVLLALSKSREGAGPPVYWNDQDDPLLQAAGFQSYEAYYDTAKLISIKRDNSGIVLTPSRNGGPGKRFLHLSKHICCQPLEADIESAIKAAFDACER